jgi:glutamyl/glutaminyl-tRNA synthetase
LGWSHGDQEIFSRDELIQFFDLNHINGAPGKFDADKCLWTNQQHIHQSSGVHLARHVAPHLAVVNIDPSQGAPLIHVCELLKERSKTLGDLAMQAHIFYQTILIRQWKIFAQVWREIFVVVLGMIKFLMPFQAQVLKGGNSNESLSPQL